MNSFPARSAAAIISRASAIEVASGFSVSTCAPCSSARERDGMVRGGRA